jgi:hypothetical protein
MKTGRYTGPPFRFCIKTQDLTATLRVYTGLSMDCEIGFWWSEQVVKHDNSMSAANKACQQLKRVSRTGMIDPRSNRLSC